MYPILRPLFFMLPAEKSHNAALSMLDMLDSFGFASVLGGHPPACPVELMGLQFPNPVGLAAGLDKNGAHIDGLAALGFGSIEIGTVTPRPQTGNPKPRLFRLPHADAIINRMGFNNDGVEALVRNVEHSQFRGILGINIGKNFDTPIENAADDYLICLRRVYRYASYITVNISSPNTKNLRQLQGADELNALLATLKAAQMALAEEHGRYVPLAVKIAPDLSHPQLVDAASAFRTHQIDAVIATNTTLSRTGVEGLPNGNEAGGLSGAPVRTKSTSIIRDLATLLAGEIPIIGVGGITESQHAVEKILAGASMVQLYSGLIYRGPGLVGECIDALLQQRSAS